MQGKQDFDRLSLMWFIWWVLSLSLPTHRVTIWMENRKWEVHGGDRLQGRRAVRIDGSRTGASPPSPSPNPTLSWHDRGSERSPMVSTHRGPPASNPTQRIELGQLPLKKIYGSCLHLPTPHMPHRHITTHIDLQIPPFVQLCFLPSRLPKLLSVLKISVT